MYETGEYHKIFFVFTKCKFQWLKKHKHPSSQPYYIGFGELGRLIRKGKLALLTANSQVCLKYFKISRMFVTCTGTEYYRVVLSFKSFVILSLSTHRTPVSHFSSFANKVYPDQTATEELSDQDILYLLCVAQEETFSFMPVQKVCNLNDLT